MPTPSLFPIYMKASAGGTSQVLAGELLLSMEEDPEVLLEDETVEVVLEPEVAVELEPEEIEVTIDG